MFAKYTINSNTIQSGTTATTLNIPIKMEYQIVDNSELTDRLFVDVETQKAVNQILDYDKVRFIPENMSKPIVNINYNLYLIGETNNIQIPTYYSNIGFDNSDIRFRKNTFKESFLNLSFYDTNNPMTQNLVGEIDIYSMITRDDQYPTGTQRPNVAGQVKPANQIPVRFILSNPLLIDNGFYAGYYLYSYKDGYVNNEPKYLYMKATYHNGKTGKSVNLMTEDLAYPIDQLVNKVYTRYILNRSQTGFYYEVDTTYSSNVTYTVNPSLQNNSDLTIKLYQIQAI